MTSLPDRSTADLLSLYRSDARVADTLREKAARVQIAGTIGSAQAFIANAVIELHGGVHVFVLTDREEAAYFLNDLEVLRGKDKDGR
jgi:transcription-repair coupling factor (superfamily II helicase)